MPLKQTGRHAHLKELIMHGADEEELVPKTSILMHYAQSVPATRTQRLEHFFGPEVLLRDTAAATRNPEHDNMLGNTKAGALAIDKDLLQDFREHWDSFCVLEKQQVLMSFMQMDPEKLKALGKEGRESIFDIIDNKAQMDEDQWVVTLSRVMRNFPRSNSIRANSADRESWYFLNKQVEEGLQAGFQAASSSNCQKMNAQDNPEDHAQGRKAKRCKTDINDSIPPMSAHCIPCWPQKRHGQPAECAIVDGAAARLWKPIRDAAREEIRTFCPVGYKLLCDYEADDPVRAGMRPGMDLLLPGKTFVEYFQTEFKHRFSRDHLADESVWENNVILRNGEWQKKPDAESVLEPKSQSLLGFERTSIDLHAPHAASLSAGAPRSEAAEGKRVQLQDSFSSKPTGTLQQLPGINEWQEMAQRLRSRRSSGIDRGA